MLTVLVNLNGLVGSLPPTSTPPWLVRFLLTSFYFNVVAMVEQVFTSFHSFHALPYTSPTLHHLRAPSMVEQVFTSFGLNLQKWLDRQRFKLREHVPWKRSLLAHKVKCMQTTHRQQGFP